MGFMSKMFDAFKDDAVKDEEQEKTISLKEINEMFNDSRITYKGSAVNEPTYFTCLKLLSESVGKLHIHLLDNDKQKITNHDAVDILQTSPNPFMTPSTFKFLMEWNRNHYGNAYAYIKTNGRGMIEGLYPLESQNVQVYVDNKGVLNGPDVYFYRYVEPKTGNVYLYRADEILHFKSGPTLNGLVGKSVREILATTISSGTDSQKFLNDLYSHGLTANAVLKYTGDLDKTKLNALKGRLGDMMTTGPMGRVIPIPMGFDLSPLNVSLVDNQFLETKQFTALQIAAAFGIKPNQLNDFTKSSYANSETQDLSFYKDTLLFILGAYEEELNLKLLSKADRDKGYHWEFNVATILRADLKSQAEALSKYVSSSIYSVNEARKKAGLPSIDGGDVIICNGSYVSLSDIGKAYGDNNK